MDKVLRQVVTDAVNEKVDDYEESISDIMEDLEVAYNDYEEVEVNNLIVRLIIKKYQGLKIIGE